MKKDIAFVIPTKDRRFELENLLENLNGQTVVPKEIVVVDSSEKPIRNILVKFPHLNTKYVRFSPPSISKQCNLGIKKIDVSIKLIGICGDDTEFEKDAIENMSIFWETAERNIGGASFNLLNHPPVYASRWKSKDLMSNLQIYSKEKGKVMQSGFHTMIGTVEKNTYTEWISTCASIWRREVLEKHQFDEWFEGYSYLEDLDFSYRVGKEYKLVVVANAKFYHNHVSKGRENSFVFGKREVINRIYFVQKNEELLLSKCYLALAVRLFLSLILGIKEHKKIYFKRVWGNIVAFLEIFKKCIIFKYLSKSESKGDLIL
jgi:GT2 family glycosyltransferase